ncbi:alkaline phosphatase family protein [Thalassoroseus pseudoceratinae]|uniref:alkaline phosphatase family protein n=1 Tax=Thalassoroseus pseudoceratinae TaxID=2713176 RepID=UPI00141FD1AF|nr:nucleotide pyrophosphatase/phosphodiesterase family protein [Thalassoroseus pseudoceratinae]
MPKKVLFVVIDALSQTIVDNAWSDTRLPNLHTLAKKGWHQPSISIFPSITPAATASLITGCFPSAHRISGAYWYDREAEVVNYFGTDLEVVLREGIAKYLRDFQMRLNHDHLQSPTLYQQAERAGLTAACLNFMWFHGDVPHEFQTPWLFKLIPDLSPAERVHGPKICYLGDFAKTPLPSTGETMTGPGGPLHKFGMSDETTAAFLLQLCEVGLPDLTVAYFPENDFQSHSEGPAEALTVIEKVDRVLGQVFELHGGIDAMLEEVAIVVTGDHSQSPLANDNTGINLDDVLSNFSLVPAGSTWQSHEDLMVCTNLRSAQIYFRKPHHDDDEHLKQVVTSLKQCPRIDQILWRSGDQDAWTYHVHSPHCDPLIFSRDPSRFSQSAHDEFGNSWSWTGDLSGLDGRVADDGVVRFRDYPNAFERIAEAFFEETGDVWVTASPGWEFVVAGVKPNASGSHGTLSAEDSISPLIVAGAPAGFEFPEQPRSVDVAPICCRLLGIETM